MEMADKIEEDLAAAEINCYADVLEAQLHFSLYTIPFGILKVRLEKVEHNQLGSTVSSSENEDKLWPFYRLTRLRACSHPEQPHSPSETSAALH